VRIFTIWTQAPVARLTIPRRHHAALPVEEGTSRPGVNVEVFYECTSCRFLLHTRYSISTLYLRLRLRFAVQPTRTTFRTHTCAWNLSCITPTPHTQHRTTPLPPTQGNRKRPTRPPLHIITEEKRTAIEKEKEKEKENEKMTRRMVYGLGLWLTIACKFSRFEVESEADMQHWAVG
jgi:hypothetical protein